MNILKLAVLGAALSVFTVSAFAENNSCEDIIKNIPGTYTLVKRTMPDGTVYSGKQVQGTTMFAKDGHRVTAVTVDEGKRIFSAAVQTDYSLTSKEFTDTLDALVVQDGSAPLISEHNQPKKSVPVVCEDEKLTIKNPPVDPLSSLTFTKTGMTAVLNKGSDAGAIDEWKKVG
ncbi:MAG TPA: hypothetical protein VGV92_08505 [Gammaproteobacteria bacterium]|nr:hypothetical protein [Gammaproteobacteria bacterium]